MGKQYERVNQIIESRDRLRALIAKHSAALRLLHDAHEAMRPFVLNAELVRDALRDFEREVK